MYIFSLLYLFLLTRAKFNLLSDNCLLFGVVCFMLLLSVASGLLIEGIYFLPTFGCTVYAVFNRSILSIY